MLQWMQQEQHSGLAPRHISYTDEAEEELPARVEEVHHAKEEGIIFDLLTNPTEILEDENGMGKWYEDV